jgi:TPP-dependent pyruvate/acetoin dehydrogenase alpha subunit/pyruvate/2-oxoglutarate/acetoin dehydrogenase E1 component
MKAEMMELHSSLGSLADPMQYQEPLNIAGKDDALLVKQLRTMLLIRYAEEKIADNVTNGKVKCPCHLGIGQEAVAVGVSASLRGSDRVFGGHRSHSHYLALGGSVYSLFAEVLGRYEGCSHGMGGSMHLYNPEIGFAGSVPIVGASVPIAVGAALAAAKDKKGNIAVSYLGDSALEEGGVQESLNLASVMKLPIIFVVENNLFASHLHISLRQPDNATIRYAEAHRINSALIDGNDIVVVEKTASEMIKRAREGQGPSFIEAVTYRWRGHVGPREDTDVGVKRKDDLGRWKGRDPVQRLVSSLQQANLFSAQEFLSLESDVKVEINDAWDRAEAAAFPETSALMDWVYKVNPSSVEVNEVVDDSPAQNEPLEKMSYAQGILDAHRYLLRKYPEVFVFGQGLWSPWYVGATMTDLDKEFGLDRIIDSPVSEVAVTGASVGASLAGYRPIVVHPRVDFMMLATDQIVTQAAKWSHMFGGQSHPAVTFRGIVNRGGEQGAQHSQAMHSWYAHVPGLRVVMPATAADARDLLIASVLCDDPVMFLDDRWLYEVEEDVPAIKEFDLNKIGPKVLKAGTDCTIVASGYSTQNSLQAASLLEAEGISCEVIDLRVINPLRYETILASVNKTRRLCVVDCGWKNCGLGGEIIAGVTEQLELGVLKAKPIRLTLTDAPAPTSKALEDIYYLKKEKIASTIKQMFEK